MNIVIIGGSGFLGSRLCASLSSAGHKVIAVARGARPQRMSARVDYIQATMDDVQALAPALAQADFLLHLAWDTTPGTSQLQPVLEAGNNMLPTLRLLEQMQHNPNCRMVFVSTGGALYSEAAATPWKEDAELGPDSYYGAAKVAAEYMLRAYHAQTGHGVIIIRPSNIYGPGQLSKRQFAVIPTLMQRLLQQQTFDIWGDGEAIRDYLFIDDFERLMSSLVEKRWHAPLFEILNAGSGLGVSLNELCLLLERISGRELPRRHLPMRAVDKRTVVLDSGKAGRLLEWSARTPLSQGLEATWQWFLAHS